MYTGNIPSSDHPISIHNSNLECIPPYQKTKISQLVPVKLTQTHTQTHFCLMRVKITNIYGTCNVKYNFDFNA